MTTILQIFSSFFMDGYTTQNMIIKLGMSYISANLHSAVCAFDNQGLLGFYVSEFSAICQYQFHHFSQCRRFFDWNALFRFFTSRVGLMK